MCLRACNFFVLFFSLKFKLIFEGCWLSSLRCFFFTLCFLLRRRRRCFQWYWQLLMRTHTFVIWQKQIQSYLTLFAMYNFLTLSLSDYHLTYMFWIVLLHVYTQWPKYNKYNSTYAHTFVLYMHIYKIFMFIPCTALQHLLFLFEQYARIATCLPVSCNVYTPQMIQVKNRFTCK